jgi:glyoxylase-like metal-dependent hydrolase (beta-lactamase superfamily II)
MIHISIDTLDVGDASSSIVWLKDDTPNHCVMLIDGGNPDDGERVADHLDKYILPHANRRAPDIVIASHPDRDHCGGLEYILQRYGRNIAELWIHDPAKHMIQGYYTYFKQYLQDRPANAAYAHILESLEHADTLISIADRLGIPRVEPFARA